MGVDLTLMPLLSPDFWAAHDSISIERRSDLWDAVRTLGEVDVPKSVTCHLARDERGKVCYGDLEDNPYGERLTYLPAGALASLESHPDVQDNWKNRGIWKLLSEMPENYPIVLYWH